MAEQLADEGLAEAHHFARAAALGVEVGAALATAHRQRGQRVLEGLLEGQELEDRQVDRRVEADAALVGADGRGVLDAVAAIDLHLTMVVDPRDAEHDDALGFDQAVEQAVLGVFAGMYAKGDEGHRLSMTSVTACRNSKKVGRGQTQKSVPTIRSRAES
jgi:hypothetical protein